MLGVNRVLAISVIFLVFSLGGLLGGMIGSLYYMEDEPDQFTLANYANIIHSIPEDPQPPMLMERRLVPSANIKVEDIKMYRRHVQILVEDAFLVSLADTGSMEPVLGKDSVVIEVPVQSAEDVQVGDIIAFDTPFSQHTIIHRVVATGYDELGFYAETQGDNLDNRDAGKVRLSEIVGEVAGILY